MSTDRELALEQALVAVLTSAVARGADLKFVVDQACDIVLKDSPYRTDEHPHVQMSWREIRDAYAKAMVLGT